MSIGRLRQEAFRLTIRALKCAQAGDTLHARYLLLGAARICGSVGEGFTANDEHLLVALEALAEAVEPLHPFTHAKRIPKCPNCGACGVRNTDHDAYCCEQCDQWLEERCSDEQCCFCASRPEKPSMKKEPDRDDDDA